MLTENRVRITGVLGTLALLAALLLYFYDNDLSTRVFALIAAGVIGLSIWVIFAPGDLQGWLSGKQAAAGSTSMIILTLFTGFVVIAYVIADRQNITVDFTTETRFSLNQASLTAIEQAKRGGRPLRLVGFYSRSFLRQREAADIILRQFDSEGEDAIELQYVDPDQEPLLARTYAYNVLGDQSNPIYLSYINPDGSPDITSIRYIGSASERDITDAILGLVSVSGSKVYFTTGHNELSITSEAGTGLSRVANVLASQAIIAEEVNLLTDDVPEDARLLIIAGPATDFQQEEVDRIAAHIARNGRLLVLANPPFVDATFGGVSQPIMEDSILGQYLWNEFGLRLREDLIVDPASSFDTEYNPVPVYYNTGQEILFGLEDVTIVFSLARSVEMAPEDSLSSQQAGYTREFLLMTSEEAYGETQLQVIQANNLTEFNEDEDLTGPLILAAASRGQGETLNEDTPRVVLVGDVDWITNDFVVQLPGNAQMWDTIIQWLTLDPELPLYEARFASSSLIPVAATDQQRQRISILTTLVLPAMVLIVGVLVWYWRRRG